MKLKIFNIFLLKLLLFHFVFAQDINYIGGFLSQSKFGKIEYLISSTPENDVSFFAAYPINFADLNLDTCRVTGGNPFELITEVSTDSILTIFRWWGDNKTYFRVSSGECNNSSVGSFIQTDVKSENLKLLSFGGKIIGKPFFANELIFFEKNGFLDTVVSISPELTPSDEYLLTTSGDSSIIYLDEDKRIIFELGSDGSQISQNPMPEFVSNIREYQNGFYSLDSLASNEYRFSRFSKTGDINFDLILQDTCQRCNYKDVIFQNEYIFLVGKIDQGLTPRMQPCFDTDPLISKFDLAGNLISIKMLDDDCRSIFKFGFSKDDDLLLFGDFNDLNLAGNGQRFRSPNGGYLKTDKNLTGLVDLEYQNTSIVNTQNINELDQFKIGPNPADGELIINIPEKNIEYKFNLFSFDGGRVRSLKFINQTRIDVSHLEHGVYIYQVINLTSGEIHTGKIMVYH